MDAALHVYNTDATTKKYIADAFLMRSYRCGFDTAAATDKTKHLAIADKLRDALCNTNAIITNVCMYVLLLCNGLVDQLENAPIPHMCYRAEFGHSMSNDGSMGEPPPP